jgi:hypothetical protein
MPTSKREVWHISVHGGVPWGEVLAPNNGPAYLQSLEIVDCDKQPK